MINLFSRVRAIRLVSALLLFSPTFAAAAETYGELTLYVMPAYPVRMDWDSPRGLLYSTLKAAIFNGELTLGHLSVEVSCGLTERGGGPVKKDPSNYLLSSSVPGPNDPSVELLLERKIGFSLQESSWAGAVETPKQVYGSFKIVNGKPKRFSAVKFMIPESSCKRLTTYFREYSAMAPNLSYGNSPRPRRKEGSGCTSFAVSFLELAGIMTPEMRKDWGVTVRVPLSLMAGYQGLKEISVWDIIRSSDSRDWARVNEPHMNLETFEPRLMHEWVSALAKSPQALRAIGGEMDTALNHGLRGIPAIRIDRRNVPTPKEPIFLGPPALVSNSDVTKIRSDKVFSENGSFDLLP